MKTTVKLEKDIETITRIEKDDITLSEKKYYIRKCLIDLLDKLTVFDRNNINYFCIELFNEINENEFGEICFRLKSYLNSIRGWY